MTQNKKGVPLPKTDRNKELEKDRCSGMTFMELGKKYNISKQRAHEIYIKVVGEQVSGKIKINKK